jgi:NAD(P)-dependent dehydrogenase (short-subunit alcohol dehydrogenase family)
MPGLLDLHGTVSVVTGATSGIGAEVARSLGEAGSRVVVVGRDQDRLARAAKAVASHGSEAHAVEVDLRSDDAPSIVVGAALERFGRIDVLVHSAGVFTPIPFAATSADVLDDHWYINLRAPYRLTQAALPHLGVGSSVIFVSSVSGHLGSPNCSAYCASKGGVELLVRALSTELAPRGIRVNAVAPGDVRTPMNEHLLADPDYERAILQATPAGRIGVVSDIAPAVVYLASAASSYVHGVSLVIDGGFSAQ